MDGGTISGTAASSIFTATLRISQVIYELKAVGEQTRDLLDSTNHIETSLQAVKTLRRQKSCHLDATEKRWIDDVLINTEKTLGNVATLIEPARVDLQTKFGSVGFVNRGLFVFRDSPKVGTNLSRLNLASQSLNTAMNILCAREGRPAISPIEKHPLQRSDTAQQERKDTIPPPTYVESEFLNRRRQSHLSRRPVTRCTSTMSLATVEEKAGPPIVEANVVDRRATETAEKSMLERKMEAIPAEVTVEEVSLTPVERYRNSPFVEPDGLQVYEAPSSQSQFSQSYDGADGLQVCNVPIPRILSFDGADGLEVCDGRYSSSPRSQGSPFDGADGLQVCSAWDSQNSMWQESPAQISQIESPQQQWREERSSRPGLAYSVTRDEPLTRPQSLVPALQGQQWHRWQSSSQHFQSSQPHSPPYPDSTKPSPPYPNSPYIDRPNQTRLSQSPLHQNPPYPDRSSLIPPYPMSSHTYPPHTTHTAPNRRLQPFQYQNTKGQDGSIERQRPPLLPQRPPSPSNTPRPISSCSSIVTSPWPASQDIYATATRPVSQTHDIHPRTESLSSMAPVVISRPTSQASTSSWAPSEVSQGLPSSIKRSRGRAWLEFQSERRISGSTCII